MKRIIVSLLISALPLYAGAQDIIVKRDGTIVKAVVTKVSETEIEYRNFGSTSERIYTLKTSGILSINYEDGTVEKFATQEQETQKQSVQGTGNRKVGPDVEANKAAIEAVNSSVATYDNNKAGKETRYSILKFAVAPKSVLVSDEVSISAETGCLYKYGKDPENYLSYYRLSSSRYGNMACCFDHSWHPHAVIIFHITNRTDRTLYMDLGNTFLSVDGQTIPYYTPGAQSTTTTSSRGASVNLGAVAGAVGIGGPVGTLASGINVGEGNSVSSNNVVFSQRVIAVAPFSKMSLEAQIIDLKDNNHSLYNYYGYYPIFRYHEPIKPGENVEFSEGTSPFKMRFFLSYSPNEDCANLNNMEVEFYVQSILGFNGNFSYKYFNFSPEALVVLSYFTYPKQ